MDWKKLFEKIETSFWELVVNLLIIIAVWFVANMILKLVSNLTGKTINKAKELDDVERGKRVITSMTVTRSVFRYVVYFVAIAFILNILGYGSSVNSLIVTAGIGSLIISLGAQSIAQDFIAGVFLTFERPYAVGDYVKIGEYEGVVSAIAVKSTYIESIDGQRIIIPNGQIKNITNYSTKFHVLRINMNTPLALPVEKATKIIEKALLDYNDEALLEQPYVQGIGNMTFNTYDVVVVAKVNPTDRIRIEQEIRLKIKQAYDKNKIY